MKIRFIRSSQPWKCYHVFWFDIVTKSPNSRNTLVKFCYDLFILFHLYVLIVTDPVGVDYLLSSDLACLDFVDDTLCGSPVSRRLHLVRPDTLSPRMRTSTEPPSIRSFTCDRYTNCISLLLSELPWRRRDRRNSLLIMFNFFSTMCYVA